MPTVQVRDFPQTLFERLQRTAEEEHRSVPQQVIAITERYVEGKNSDLHEDVLSNRQTRSSRAALFEALRAAEPAVVPDGFPSIADLIREDRDNR